MKYLAILVLVYLQFSCSSKESADKNAKNANGFQPTQLARSSYLRSLVQQSQRFVAYNPAAERLAVVDPVDLHVVSSLDVAGDFEFVAALPGIDAVALIKSGLLQIQSAGSSRDFVLPDITLDRAFWYAEKTFAFVTNDQKFVHIIRHLDGADWQQESLEIPASVGSGVAAVVIHNGGNAVTVTWTHSGAHYSYTAASAKQKISGPVRSCGAATNFTNNLVSFAVDEEQQRLLVGDLVGVVKSIAIASSAACDDPSTLTSIVVGEGAVTAIAHKSGAEYLAATKGGTLIKFTSTATALALSGDAGKTCDAARFILPLTQDRVAAFCLNQATIADDGNVQHYGLNLHVYAFTGDLIRSTIAINDSVASLAFSDQPERVFLMEQGGFGSLTAFDLHSDSATRVSAPLLGGIIDSIRN